MRTRLLLGSAASAAAVALVTGAVYALRPAAPVLSLGVLYVFAVLPIAAVFGLGFAVPVSVVSMLTFNFLFCRRGTRSLCATRRTGSRSRSTSSRL